MLSLLLSPFVSRDKSSVLVGFAGVPSPKERNELKTRSGSASGGRNDPAFGQELNYWRARDTAQLGDRKMEKKTRNVQSCPSPGAKLDTLLCISLQPHR